MIRANQPNQSYATTEINPADLARVLDDRFSGFYEAERVVRAEQEEQEAEIRRIEDSVHYDQARGVFPRP